MITPFHIPYRKDYAAFGTWLTDSPFLGGLPMSEMLPHQIFWVREIGDTESPYWTAASLDGMQLHLEPDESILHVCYCHVSQLAERAVQTKPSPSQTLAKKWQLPDATTVVITDRRIAFMTTQFDKGGGWSGFGLAGLAVAATANAVSKNRAAKRSAGKIAIGQLRHEWLTAIAVRYRKPVFGRDTYVHLAAATSAGTAIIELYKPQVVDEKLARWLVSTVATNRLALLSQASPDLATLQGYRDTGNGAVQGANPGDLRWPLPGNTGELIAKLIAQPEAR